MHQKASSTESFTDGKHTAVRFRREMTRKDIHSLVGKIKNTGRNTRLNKTFGYFEIKFKRKKKNAREEENAYFLSGN